MASSGTSMRTFLADPKYSKLSELVSGLFICGITDVNRETIEKHGITLVINATDEVPTMKVFNDVVRLKLWLEDTKHADLYPHLHSISDQIEMTINEQGKVLVHCVAGVSRSAAICLAFLTKYRCKSLRDAYELMASKRPLVRPNIGFWRHLIRFEQEVKKSLASVHLIQDDDQEDGLLPDVYLPLLETSQSADSPGPSTSSSGLSQIGSSRSKYKPSLETLSEDSPSPPP